MSAQGHKAYTTHQRSDETIRETEAHALLSCANRLELACRPGCDKDEFVGHIRHNQELWTLFQVTLVDPTNKLPKALKQILLNISRYVDKASFKAIGERSAEPLKGLANINRTIAAGLAVKPKTETKMASDEPVPTSVTTTI